MFSRGIAAVFASVVLLGVVASAASAQVTVRLAGDGQGQVVVAPGSGPVNFGGGWGWGGAGMKFEQFMQTLTELNMTPDFTLDKEAKQKLQDLRAEFRKAQAKFMEDHKEDFQKLGQQQMEAFQAGDQEKGQELIKAMQDLQAKGPGADEYVTKAKAVLTAEQVAAVDAKIAKAEADRKAMMEKWQKAGGGAGGPGGGVR